jgi:PAS domain S-box-containing protein
MKKPQNSLWFFPSCLFIFFSIFLLVKFIFIFFFSAAYEPKFIFDLTPFYLFSGISTIHLLFLSLGVVLFDTFLHLKATKRRLLYSYLPTALILSGLGITIMFNEVSIMYVFHYIVFGLLLLTVLIDHNSMLTSQETHVLSPGKKHREPHEEKKPLAALFKPVKRDAMKPSPQPQFTTEAGLTLTQKDSYEVILKNIQSLFESLERRTMKLEQVENEIEDRRRNLIQQEEMFIDRLTYHLKSKERFGFENKDGSTEISSVNQIFIKDKIIDHLVMEDATDFIAVVQRGVVKQVSNSFAHFLGYDACEVINKKLFVFFTPEGMKNLKQFCENKLKGVTLNSYQSVFLTKKYDQRRVEITVQPTTYHGDAAEILIVKEIK